jgi:hypothetical protein
MPLRDGDPHVPGPDKRRVILSIAAIISAIFAITLAYDFGNPRSHSETYGTVTETEAQDGVTPSIAPDAGAEATPSESVSSEQ